ncbi:isopenicillin N synthase family dioxygenase [Uliginosibacterium sediminicola]|uniref:2-oxoglutarate-dependent ethylene/succinate-forming enzyme n=1 Tax=Uliginosibacterium sediminicola TaxID=2024550 RepID=A0ABU9YY07_9RHOO
MPSSSTKAKHTDFKQLPVVDISGLYADDPVVRQQAAEQLGTAARDAGFLYVTGHAVPQSLIDNLLRLTKDYFAQDLDAKMQDYIGQSSNHSGYVPQGEEQFYGAKPDFKEAYDVGFDLGEFPADLQAARQRPMLGANQWSAFPGFKTHVSAYYKAVYDLSRVLFRGFALALGLEEDNLLRLVSTPPSQLRLIHYPYNPAIAAERPGIGEHTDYECFTILLPTTGGLEVQNGANEWIPAPVVPGAFVINIGDMLEILSNGRFVATKHRVRKVPEERYSFPLFCACDYDTVIAPLPELLPADGHSDYAPQICGQHLYAQTMQTFKYLRTRLEQGELALPDGALPLSSFGPKTR